MPNLNSLIILHYITLYCIITPIFKKEDNMSKVNYRTISFLLTSAKLFERLIHRQLPKYIS